MTKKEARAQKAEWAKALVEGRVVRSELTGLTSYPTVERAEQAVRDNIAQGLESRIVDPDHLGPPVYVKMRLEREMKVEKKSRPKREVRVGKQWIAVKGASAVLPTGWLHYELRDGTNGLAQPKNWREVSAPVSQKE